MASTQETGPVQTSLDRVRTEMERIIEMARDRGGKVMEAAGVMPMASGMFPLTDVIETNDAVHIAANLPGVSAELLDVNITGQVLRLRGSVAPSPHQQGGKIHRHERLSGAFERTFPLPCAVDASSAQAELAHGVLQIRLPKVAEEIGHKVPVRGASEVTTASVTTPEATQ